MSRLQNLFDLIEKFKNLSGEKPVILFVDDESDLLEIIGSKLEKYGFEAILTKSSNEAIEKFKQHQWKTVMVLSDYNMPEMNGFVLCEKIKAINAQVPFVILSGMIDKEMAMKGIEMQIAAFLNKPYVEAEFEEVLSKEAFNRLNLLYDECDLLKGFIDDARNLLEQIESSVLDLEARPDNPEIINIIFGMVHTIKGSSAFFEPKILHSFTHRFEDLLKNIQNGFITPDSEIVSIILKSIDIIKELIGELESHNHKVRDLESLIQILKYQPNKMTTPERAENEPKTVDTAEQKVKKANEVRVEMSVLDEFLHAAGEMTVVRNMINKVVSSVEKKYSGDKEISTLSELLDELHKINAQVHSKITDIRKVPMKHILKPIPRVVRDTSKSLNKKVEVDMIGSELKIDTSIAEVLNSSLVHLVRNSLDHGVESPEKRKAAGKPEVGKITIKSHSTDENVIVEISDDGNGISTKAIKKKLISNGRNTEGEVDKIPDQVLHMMIFDAGFSTAAQVTDLSGRGVGMSMVKSSVESIGGSIKIRTEEGRGTTFVLELPIPKSVLIKNSLLVKSGEQEYGLPQDQILRVVKVTPDNYETYINALEGTQTLRLDNHIYPIVDLRDILNQEKRTRQCMNCVLVLVQTLSNVTYALVVDELLDFEDAVVKGLNSVFKKIDIYYGATFLGDGHVGLLIDVDGVARKIGIAEKNEHQEANIKGEYRETAETDWLLFKLNTDGIYSVERKQIFRLEEMERQNFQIAGGHCVVPFRNKIMTIFNISQLFSNNLQDVRVANETIVPLFVVETDGHFIGFEVDQLVDIISTNANVEESAKPCRGVRGSFIYNEQTITVLDPLVLLEDQRLLLNLTENFDDSSVDSQIALPKVA